jgi:hypothetical protein
MRVVWLGALLLFLLGFFAHLAWAARILAYCVSLVVRYSMVNPTFGFDRGFNIGTAKPPTKALAPSPLGMELVPPERKLELPNPPQERRPGIAARCP